MNARQLIEGIENKRKRKIIEYLSSSESDDGVSNVEIEEEVDERKVNFLVEKSNRGKDNLWFDGFCFCFDKKTKNRAYWKCVNKKCGVTASTDSGNYLEGIIKPNRNPESHNHLPKPKGLEVRQRLNVFKERLQNELEVPASDLIQQTKETDDDELFTQLPGFDALAKLGARKRKKYGKALNAETAAKIELPEEFKFKDGKRYLIYDSEDKRPGADDRVLVFASEKAITLLRQNKHWAADSTFWTCPHQFAQQFVIGFFIQHRMIPACTALMTKKTQRQYAEVLNALKNVLNDDLPNSVLTDFETPEFSAFAKVFPLTTNKACLFHLCQSFIRRIRKLGLIGRYKNNEAVRRTVRWCSSMAFLPPELVRRAFSLTINQSPPELAEFLFYVGKNYIGLSEWENDQKHAAFLPQADEDRLMAGLAMHSTPLEITINSTAVRSLLTPIRRRGSFEVSIQMPNANPFDESQALVRHELPIVKPPKFAINLWNVRDRVEDELPRCQASAEANNLAFQKKNCRQPKMDEFLRQLRKYDSKKMNEAREIVLQPDKNKRRKKNKVMDDRLKHLVQTAPLLNDESIRVFLQAISLALQGLEEDLIINDEEESNAMVDENEAEEQFEEIDELYEWPDENFDPTNELIRDVKAPILRSPVPTFDLPSTSHNISTDSDHDYLS